MTSLAGCSGEDFASVLRSIGYRMEKRPKQVAPPPVPAVDLPINPGSAAGPTTSALPADVVQSLSAASEATAIVLATDEAPSTDPDRSDAPSVNPTDTAFSDQAIETVPVSSSDNVEGVISVQEAPTFAASEPPEPEVAQADIVAPDQGAEHAPQQGPVEPELIEVWRPGRREEQPRRPRGARTRANRAPRRADAPAAAAPPAETAEKVEVADAPVVTTTEPLPAPAARPRADRADRADRRPPPRPDSGERAGRWQRADRPDRAGRAARGERSDRHREERASRGERPDRDPELRAKYIKGREDGRGRRDREPDPNSPFAKLAALKEQLEANTKEPR
jgi:ATP-dependent RNA helicase SUPV3L1/SUV3